MPKINTTVLMSDTQHFSAEQAINPYYYDSHINSTQAAEEHNSIAALLTKAGVTVISTSSPAGSQDGVYTANWALVRGDKAVLARLPEVRKAEEAHAEEILKSLGKEVIYVPEGLKFSGQGDALACGNLLFCGSGYRSDAAAQAFAADVLGYERIQLQAVPERTPTGEPQINAVSGWPDSFFYDIDLAIAILRAPDATQKGLIAYCPEAFTRESQLVLEQLDSVEKITVSLEEAEKAFALNMVSTGTTVVMSAHAPHFQAELEHRGFTVYSPEISELAKGGGYIRCTTLTVD